MRLSLDNDAQVETIDRNHSLGRRVYVRSFPEDRSGAVAEKRELCLFLLARPAVLQRLLPRGRHGAARLYQSQWVVILSFHGLARHAGRQRDRKPALYPPRRRGVSAPGAHAELYGVEKGSEQFRILTVPWDPSLPAFCRAAKEKSKRQTAFLESASETDDLVYLSCLPWFDLTCCTNERNFDKDDAIPRITWGKYVRQGGHETLGLSIEVNHRFVDGVHLGRFYEALQQKINDLE